MDDFSAAGGRTVFSPQLWDSSGNECQPSELRGNSGFSFSAENLDSARAAVAHQHSGTAGVYLMLLYWMTQLQGLPVGVQFVTLQP